MKNKKKLFAILAVALIFVMTACGGGGGGNSVTDEEIDPDTPLNYYSVSIPTAEEEASQFVGVLLQYKWYQDMGYTHVTLPSHPVINPLKQKVLSGGQLTYDEQLDAYYAFINDIYNAADYQQAFAKMKTAAATADKQIDSLRRYETAWGFYIPSQYIIYISLYGPGGQYGNDYSSSTGYITITVLKNGQLNFNKNPLEVILHESVHIGIESRIIQEYGLEHWEKERLVDQFVKKHFSSVVPNYQMQNISAPEIDKIFKDSDVLDKLPQKIEAMKQ
jgi:hypothetical protein